jgi:propionaldehyde dehydrogenase
VICNSIGMIAAGNTAVFSPHPGALQSCLKTVRILNKAIHEAGGPNNLITTLMKPTLESTDAMINNKKIRMIVATGGPAIVKKVLSSGKKAIGAGAGNPPVVVDETADIKKAARDIIAGCCFDNNLPCIAEKEVLAVEQIYENLIHEMNSNGNVYELNAYEIDKLVETVLVKKEENGKSTYVPNKKYIGKDAEVILKAIGVVPPKGVECIICRTENEHPFVQEELMMPILPIVKVKDVDEAIRTAVLDEHGNRHTAMMHSKNVDNLTKMARVIDTTIFVKNAPSYAGIGLGGEGWTTFTIAGPTGEGITNACSFTRQRRCTMADSFRII